MLPQSSGIVILIVTVSRERGQFPLSLHHSYIWPSRKKFLAQDVELDLASLITLNVVASRSIPPAYELLTSIPEVRRVHRVRESNHDHLLQPIILEVSASCSERNDQ